jgi:hypothetical protein
MIQLSKPPSRTSLDIRTGNSPMETALVNKEAGNPDGPESWTVSLFGFLTCISASWPDRESSAPSSSEPCQRWWDDVSELKHCAQCDLHQMTRRRGNCGQAIPRYSRIKLSSPWGCWFDNESLSVGLSGEWVRVFRICWSRRTGTHLQSE